MKKMKMDLSPLLSSDTELINFNKIEFVNGMLKVL